MYVWIEVPDEAMALFCSFSLLPAHRRTGAKRKTSKHALELKIQLLPLFQGEVVLAKPGTEGDFKVGHDTNKVPNLLPLVGQSEVVLAKPGTEGDFKVGHDTNKVPNSLPLAGQRQVARASAALHCGFY
ncbi:MAG TPA: hypothetical protein VKN36_06385 [Eudoraea sp.]|nr:hypothetical protein [Eudoraea sp.]